MKRIVLPFLIILTLAACSLQPTMSPELFFERLEKYDNSVSISKSFYKDDSYICFLLYHNAEIVVTVHIDKKKNAKKINLACVETDKINEFTDFAESVIRIYAPDDDYDAVIENLFKENGFSYYDSQWHKYSAASSDSGLYFSVSSKKLVPESEVEFSLKQNDIVEY